MKRICLVLLFCVASLLVLGVVLLNSATITQNPPYRFHSHLAWLGIGLGCCIAMSLCDYTALRRNYLQRILMAGALVLLVLVLVPGLGVEVQGGRRWLRIGGQPSEFAKLALIIALADYGARHQLRMSERNIGFLFPGLIAGAVIVLVFFEHDWGTAVLIGALTIAMLLIAGTSWGYILPAVIIGAELFALLLLHNPLRLARFLSFTDPERFQHGVGWQGWHSVLAIGSGGLHGTFFGRGINTIYVPERETDFIFSLVGEELGFFGATAVVILFVAIVIAGMRIAWRITDPFGQLLASGITLLIGLQAFINIGVATSSLPNKGISLPFVSYGGSNLIVMLTAIGLLISVARRAPVMPEYQLDEASNKNKRPFATPTRAIPNTKAGDCRAVLRRHPRARGWKRLAVWKRRPHVPRFYLPPQHSYQCPPRRLPERNALALQTLVRSHRASQFRFAVPSDFTDNSVDDPCASHRFARPAGPGTVSDHAAAV
jgi:cell division protein FtsW